MNEIQKRTPLKPADGKMLSPWKDNTDLRRALMRMANLAAALLKLERAFGDEDVYVDFSERWSWEKPYARINCDDEEKARKMVGKLIMAMRVQPKMKKVADDAIHAHFDLDACEVVVMGYKPKTCRYEEIEVDIPAEPEKRETIITEAKPARKEKRRVIVCDDAKAEPQVPEEVAAASSASRADRIQADEEVPF